MIIEQLKKILESERVINCHNYREHLKRVGTIIESGMSSWAKTANGYRDGSKAMENRLLPLLEKAVDILSQINIDNPSFEDSRIEWMEIQIDKSLAKEIREFLAEIKKESGK